jgi:DNA-binding NtrC family response regulator
MLIRIMVLLEPTHVRRRFERLISGSNVLVTSITAKRDFWSELGRGMYDLILLNQQAIREPIATAVSAIRSLPDQPDVIVLSGAEDAAERASLLAAGCLAVVSEGLSDAAVGEVLAAIVGRQRAEAFRRFKGERPDFEPSLQDFVSTSPAMQTFMSLVGRVVAADSSLLITGETGVGKERLARAIHNESPRGRAPFIAVNCAALPETLLESELFGHEQGAFTGASRARRGHFELAHRGTIFLDEIGEIPLHLQAKLLQALQDHTIRPLGSERSVKVDARVVAATNRDLEAEMRLQRFRQDLFYRLSVVSLRLPPLRDRREDIPDLIDSYLEHFCARFSRPMLSLAPDARESLVQYSWPGNVRELINVIERAVLLCAGPTITTSELPETIARPRHGPVVRLQSPPAEEIGLKTWRETREHMLTRLEHDYLAAVLRASGGRVGEAARRADMAPRSLYEKMLLHGLHKEDFRPKPH